MNKKITGIALDIKENTGYTARSRKNKNIGTLIIFWFAISGQVYYFNFVRHNYPFQLDSIHNFFEQYIVQ